MTTPKSRVKNAALWRRLPEAMSRHEVTWIWVKGHAGDPGNEHADALASGGIEEAASAAHRIYPAGSPQLRARDPYGGAKTTIRARSAPISVNECASPAGTNTTL